MGHSTIKTAVIALSFIMRSGNLQSRVLSAVLHFTIAEVQAFLKNHGYKPPQRPLPVQSFVSGR